jgi:hypothetical protein
MPRKQTPATDARRTGKRFPLELPITIVQKGKGKSAGTTANVSAAGVFIESQATIEVGSPIEFDITLPGKVVGTDHDVQIHCKGRVVRSEEKDKKKNSRKRGVACVIDQYKFVRK